MSIAWVDIIIANECNEMVFDRDSIKLVKDLLATCNNVNSLYFKKRVCRLREDMSLLELYAEFPSVAMIIGLYLSKILNAKKEKSTKTITLRDIILAFSAIDHVGVVGNTLLEINSTLDYSSTIPFDFKGVKRYLGLAQYLLAHMLLPCKEVGGEVVFDNAIGQTKFITNTKAIRSSGELTLYHFGERLTTRPLGNDFLQSIINSISKEEMFKELVSFVRINHRGIIDFT